jgi:hypothetical protein
VTRPAEDVLLVQTLFSDGFKRSEIARLTGINRSTVGDWIRDRRSPDAVVSGSTVLQPHHAMYCSLRIDVPSESYAYLLGLYLGDGCISLMEKGVFILRIACCDTYQYLMDLCEEAIHAVMPHNKVFRNPAIGYTAVSCCSKHWPCLFPQHGPGRKHERPIILEPWQQAIVEVHPRALLRGLVHSDGSRYLNTVNPRGKSYSYPSYCFRNVSADILDLFVATCDLIGVKWRRTRNGIYVTQRASVAVLDEFIGPKT